MAKRKKKITTRRVTTSKKRKSEEEEQPSSSKDEDEDLLPPPPCDEKCTTSVTNNDEDDSNISSPCNGELDSSVSITEPSNINEDEDPSPGSPNEFIFSPMEQLGEGSSSTEQSSPSTVECDTPSTSTSRNRIPFLTSVGCGCSKTLNPTDSSTENSNDTELNNNRNNTNRNAIEIIDVDELPDTPSSPIGDDVIEITPGNSNRTSRSNSPEIIMNRHIVDLTGSVDIDSSFLDFVAGTEEDDPEEEDAFLSLWSLMHERETVIKPTSAATTSSSACSSSSKDTISETNKNEEDSESSTSGKLQCPICMDDFAQIVKTRRLYSTSCGHVFCEVCVKAAVETQKRCPTCRKKQTMKKLHPIFL